MNPMVKYALARLGLFIVVGGVLLAFRLPIQPLLTLMIALLISAILAWVLLRKMRDQVAAQLADRAVRRGEEKERLRSALAGDDPDGAPGAGGAQDGADAPEADDPLAGSNNADDGSSKADDGSSKPEVDPH